MLDDDLQQQNLNDPSLLLARLIARDDEVREINALLLVTSERLDSESNRANSSERRAIEYFNRLRQVTENRDRAEQESARLREELKLYKIQLDNAQKEIFRAQDIINHVSAQKSEAEADAATARSKARKLHEEKMVMIAHEEGRHRGYKEGLSLGRRLAFDQPRPNNPSARFRPVSPNQEDDFDDDSVHSERDNAPIRPTSHPLHPRSESAPPLAPLPVIIPSNTPSVETIYPVHVRSAHSTADVPQDDWISIPPPHRHSQPTPISHSHSHSHESDLHPSQSTLFATDHPNYPPVRTRDFAYTQPAPIPVPVPAPVPVPRPRTPSLISRSSTHMSQYDLVSAPHERRPGSSLRHDISSSMHTRSRSGSGSATGPGSFIQPPQRHIPSRGEYQHQHIDGRNRREELIEQWLADPEVVATATPGTALRDFQSVHHHPPVAADARPASRGAEAGPRPQSQPQPVHTQAASPPRSRNPLDYFNIRRRFQQRTHSSSSVPNITVEPPSDDSCTTPSERSHLTRPELLSPDSAAQHRALPVSGPVSVSMSGSHEDARSTGANASSSTYAYATSNSTGSSSANNHGHSHSHGHNNNNIYRSTTPAQTQTQTQTQGPWPAGFVPIPVPVPVAGRGSGGESRQHSRDRDRDRVGDRVGVGVGRTRSKSRGSGPGPVDEHEHYHHYSTHPSNPAHHAHANPTPTHAHPAHAHPTHHYQMSPIPEGVTYPEPPLLSSSSSAPLRHAAARGQGGGGDGIGDDGHGRDSGRGRGRGRGNGTGIGTGIGTGDGAHGRSSPAPLQRPISLFSDQDHDHDHDHDHDRDQDRDRDQDYDYDYDYDQDYDQDHERDYDQDQERDQDQDLDYYG